jgi:zinc transporter
MLPAPVCAFDIAPDGVATPCAINKPQNASWRWLNFDLGDPALGDWLSDKVPTSVTVALQLPQIRPRFNILAVATLINLRGVKLKPGALPEDMIGLHICATADRFITVRKLTIMVLEATRQEMVLGKSAKTMSAFLAEMAKGLTQRIKAVSLISEDRVDELQEVIITKIPINAGEVLNLRQSLAKMRRLIGSQRKALQDLSIAESGLPDVKTAPHLLETTNRAARTIEALDVARDRMAVMQKHLDIEAKAAMGRNGYVLSIVARIFVRLVFLTGFFGVNLDGAPRLDTQWAI